jgi:hypothetical protein
MSRFEDDLWETLSREHGAATVRAGRSSDPVARRRGVLPLAVGTLTLAAATTTAVLLLSAGNNPPAAYAVTQNADGTVTLTLNQVIWLQPANEELVKLGVRVVIAKVERHCNETGQIVGPPDGGGRIIEMVHVERSTNGRLIGLRWVIHRAAIPPGDTLQLTAQIVPNSRVPGVAGSLALFRGQAPKCTRTGVVVAPRADTFHRLMH